MRQGTCPKTGNAHTLPAADGLGGKDHSPLTHTWETQPAPLRLSSCCSPLAPLQASLLPAGSCSAQHCPSTPKHPPLTACQISCAKWDFLPKTSTGFSKPLRENPEYFTMTLKAWCDLRPALHPDLTSHHNRPAPCTREACSDLRDFAPAAPPFS